LRGRSTPAVIGAMIVAPLATPMYGVALATVTGSRRDLFASLGLLVADIALNIFLALPLVAAAAMALAAPAAEASHGA
jgi:hypothetical protein